MDTLEIKMSSIPPGWLFSGSGVVASSVGFGSGVAGLKMLNDRQASAGSNKNKLSR